MNKKPFWLPKGELERENRWTGLHQRVVVASHRICREMVLVRRQQVGGVRAGGEATIDGGGGKRQPLSCL
jgi:hypothetical protein